MILKKSNLEKTKEKYEQKTEKLKAKRGFIEQIKSIRFDTFTKAMVGLIIIMACIDLQLSYVLAFLDKIQIAEELSKQQLSYVLAFLDKIQIAEELSKQVCTTILGVALVYMIRAYFDSRAEYKTKNDLNETIEQKTIETLQNANINNMNMFKEEDN